MSRTVAGKHAEAESFSGLLDRLSRRGPSPSAYSDLDASLPESLNGKDLPHFDVDTEPGLGRDRYTASGSSARLGKRALRPHAEPAPMAASRRPQATKGSDTAQLSYEQALRIHGRRSPQPEIPFDPPLPPVARTGLPKSGHPSPESSPKPISGRATRRDARGTLERKLTPNLEAKPKPAAKPMHIHTAASPVADSTEPGDAVARAMQARRAARAALKLDTARTPPPRKASSKPVGSATRQHASATQPIAADKSRREAPTPPGKLATADLHVKSVPASWSSTPETRGKAKKTTKIKVQPSPQALELAGNLPRDHTVDHRRAIVSIRLNDEEAERLRLRAAESGISVSAYMRSCMLEAEHLRAQVKAALAEMRSSVRAPTGEPGSPAAADRSVGSLATLSGIPRSGPVSGWSRLLWRSATFFLGPWFPSRHRV